MRRERRTPLQHHVLAGGGIGDGKFFAIHDHVAALVGLPAARRVRPAPVEVGVEIEPHFARGELGADGDHQVRLVAVRRGIALDRDTRAVEVDDITNAQIRFENGVTGNIEANWMATGRAPGSLRRPIRLRLASDGSPGS